MQTNTDSGFASEGEWKDIDSVDDDLCRFIIKHSGAYTAVDLGEIKLSPFRTHHDAYEPARIRHRGCLGERCCVVLDTKESGRHASIHAREFTHHYRS
ncbi:hypothetical protein P7H06_21915 [Paenibacillus larvae]|nr:hypothetical protein [Paenibacillus larvae]MDT2261619.1 hypothetical protein [Paenibacillus larvae]